ncbi:MULTISPECIES: threonine-phosphate decarboxylase CobD [unclassified Dyella]|uniref:threonine-phosphate decarboxylase CobD n=1 Tax=unclassified Dyella TaxID=2634549 RepID=UPI000C862F44|nr:MULTISPECIES: threonine-phosphate decarboxylase CobD [unclassified Dyella]MDR3445119.1 threonine-phosphate decarboxylase CobD [Dyella sp.]PMQ07326.1 Threonine-phosphate decarboxylase [Dyella sp. AD56]
MLEHGGRLLQAARTYGIPPDRWLDLSTGVSPFAWPVPSVPASVWQRLPEDDDGLVEIACAYYGALHVLPVAGSQAAIQALPVLRPPSRVGVIAPGYNEHAHAWRRAGHMVDMLPASALLADVSRFDVVVLIHPNNPGGDRFDPAALRACHQALASRGGWLIVDEAFMDATPGESLCGETWREGLVVLRSAGKFFGMAGARAGFVAAQPELLEALRDRLGPWTLSGPTRFVLKQALADVAWHAEAREWLRSASDRLASMLSRYGMVPTAGCAFFQWWQSMHAESVHVALARQGILTRLFSTPASLRFGLPADADAFQQLDEALQSLKREKLSP